MFIVIFISIYIKNLKIENKLDTEETLKLVSEDDLKELIPVVGERLLTKKILKQVFPPSDDEQCVCYVLYDEIFLL